MSRIFSSRFLASNKHKILNKNDGEEDIISKLPEELISRILSFLPTKDAVRTSVLSKKWLFQWISITKLDLNDTVFFHSRNKKKGGKQYLVNFMNRVLFTKTSSLESVSLVLANKYDVSLFNTWISNIFIRNIKILSIDTNFDMPFSAITSYYVFKCWSIEKLMLKIDSCVIRVAASTYVYFGHLQLLKLCGILFTLDSSSNLTLSLPVLKVVETKDCAWLKAKRVTLKVPQLERVIIVQDAKSRAYETRNCAIEFCTSLLKEFTYSGYDYVSHYFKVLDPSSAHNASLNISVYPCEKKNRDPKTEFRAFLLLKQFSQMQCLNFEGSEALAQSRVATLPLFGMLSHLEIGLVRGEVLLGLLIKSPVLKTLVFKGISKFDKGLLDSAAVPDCFTSTLKVVKFHKVHGFENELCLAKFVMENSLVLQRMSFFLASFSLGNSKVIEEFKEKLFSVKKAFSCAIIEFSFSSIID